MFERFKKQPTEQDLEVRKAYQDALLIARKKEAERVAKAKAKQEADNKINGSGSGGLKGALSSLNSARQKFIEHMDGMPDVIEGSYFNDKGVYHGKEKKKAKEMI